MREAILIILILYYTNYVGSRWPPGEVMLPYTKEDTIDHLSHQGQNLDKRYGFNIHTGKASHINILLPGQQVHMIGWGWSNELHILNINEARGNSSTIIGLRSNC